MEFLPTDVGRVAKGKEEHGVVIGGTISLGSDQNARVKGVQQIPVARQKSDYLHSVGTAELKPYLRGGILYPLLNFWTHSRCAVENA